jgi:hypothetical protein
VKHQSIKNVMFHANDGAKHDVYWSEAAKAWTLENEKDGLIRCFDTLCSALSAMHVRSSDCLGYGQDYVAQVPDRWTMTRNPYASNVKERE